MLALRAPVSHRSPLAPDALLRALARRAREHAWRSLFARADLLVGRIDGREVWLRPVGTRWENPPCELAAVVEPRDGGSLLRGEVRLPRRVDRILVAVFPLVALALAIPTAIRDSPGAGLAILGVAVALRLVLQAFCLRDRAEILRVVRLAEGEASRHGAAEGASSSGPTTE